MRFKNILEIDIDKIRRQFKRRLREQPPEGLASPELLEVLGFCGSDVHEDAPHWYDPSDAPVTIYGKALEPVIHFAHDLRCDIVMTVRDGDMTYLVGEDMELLTRGYDEIRSYAGQGFNSALFEVREGKSRGIVDLRGRSIADVKYACISPRSVMRDIDGGQVFQYADLFCVRRSDSDGINNWEVLGADGAAIFRGLCSGLEVCELNRRYRRFVTSQEVGTQRYSDRVKSFYIYKAYSYAMDTDSDLVDNVFEHAFKVSVFALLLGNAEVVPEGIVELRSFEYPRQQQKLSLKRDLLVLGAPRSPVGRED